jgi:PIN like domain
VTKKLKLMFDECIGKPVMESLPQLLSFSKHDQFELGHVLDRQKQGIHDEDWIPQLAPEGWIVVTGDRGKGGKKKGEKLPFVCMRNQVTHIMLGPSLLHKPSFDKVVAIVQVWDEIAKLPDAPAGSAFLLSVKSGRAKLIPKPQA